MTQHKLLSEDEVERWLSRRVKKGDGLVGVEGYARAGKTSLAKHLAAAVSGAVHIATDTYASQRDESTKSYVDCLDLQALSDDISSVRQRGSALIIEGICLRDVLEELNIAPDTAVYVKRITEAGLWADELANYLRGGELCPGLGWLDRQMAEYHQRVRPDHQADAIYERREDSEAYVACGPGDRTG